MIEVVFPYLATGLLSLIAFMGASTLNRVNILERELRGQLAALDRRVSRIEGANGIHQPSES